MAGWGFGSIGATRQEDVAARGEIVHVTRARARARRRRSMARDVDVATTRPMTNDDYEQDYEGVAVDGWISNYAVKGRDARRPFVA